MGISDWSSDVCSSDLSLRRMQSTVGTHGTRFKVRKTAGSGSRFESGKKGRWQEQAHPCHLARLVMVGKERRRSAAAWTDRESGRASCREGVCQYVWNPVVGVYLKKKK